MKSTSMTKPALMAASAMAMALTMSVAQPGSAAAAEMEKCYGVVKAGKNDCATANSSCAGTSKSDRQADAYIAVPKGTCEKIAGGTLKSA